MRLCNSANMHFFAESIQHSLKLSKSFDSLQDASLLSLQIASSIFRESISCVVNPIRMMINVIAAMEVFGFIFHFVC